MQETRGPTLGQDGPLEEGVATHSTLLSRVQLTVTPRKPVLFLPRESHAQRSLAGYGPQGRKESDTTEPLNNSSNNFPSELLNPTLFHLEDAAGVVVWLMFIENCSDRWE